MSPQYNTLKPYSNSCVAHSKARKMLQEEDPRFRNLDRMLARAYIMLQKQRAQQKKIGVFTPRMDLYDDPKNPYITAMLEVPGMKAEQLSVRIENGRLIVEGERTGPHLHTCNGETRNANPAPEPSVDGGAESAIATLYPVRELKYGKFRRDINLPAGVNAVNVRSTLIEGMLTISWPRDPSLLGGQPVADNPAHTAALVGA